jgi:predicted acetyltransferase
MGRSVELGDDGIEIRGVEDDDLPGLLANDVRAFGMAQSDPEVLDHLRVGFELDRFLVAVDDGEIVGNVGAFTFGLTLPGGAAVPAAGVTWVAVSPTHRRRGLMRRLLDHLHADAVERGEVAAVLWAAESSIYGNVGYGPTHQQRLCAVDTTRVRFRDDAPTGGTVRYLDGASATEVLAPIGDRARHARPGAVLVSPAWWRRLQAQLVSPTAGKPRRHVLVHRDERGEPDGYAIYSSQERWVDGVARGEVDVGDVVACTPAAHAELWRVLCSLDLVVEVTTDQLPLDDPLPWMLLDQRAIRTTNVADGLWLKVFDVPGVFGERTYATDDAVVVDAGDLGRWRIGGPGRCDAAGGSAPEVSMSPVELGAVSLGGTAVRDLVAAGRVREHVAGAGERLGRALAADPGPCCTTHF